MLEPRLLSCPSTYPISDGFCETNQTPTPLSEQPSLLPSTRQRLHGASLNRDAAHRKHSLVSSRPLGNCSYNSGSIHMGWRRTVRRTSSSFWRWDIDNAPCWHQCISLISSIAHQRSAAPASSSDVAHGRAADASSMLARYVLILKVGVIADVHWVIA